MNHQFKTAPIRPLLLKLAIPMIVAYLVQALYNVVDSVIVSFAVNEQAFTALGVVFPIQLILSSISTLFAAGAAALISISLGRNEIKKAGKISTTAYILALITTILAGSIVFFFATDLLTFFGAKPDFIEYANVYLKIIIFGLPFVAINNISTFVLRSKGITKRGMNIMLIGTILNVILNPILVISLNMGVAGSAIATIISQLISSIYAVYYIFFRVEGVKNESVTKKDVVSYGSDIFKLGLSSFIGTVTFSAVVIISNVVLSKYGTTQDMGIFNAIIKINELLVLPLFGLIAGIQPIVGYNYGNENYERVEEAYKVGLSLVVKFLLIAMVIIFIFPEFILKLFSISGGAWYMRISFAMFVFTGIQITGSQFLQAIDKKQEATMISLSRHIFLYIPIVLILSYILNRFAPEYTVYAVFISMAVADLISGFITTYVVRKSIVKMHTSKTHISIPKQNTV